MQNSLRFINFNSYVTSENPFYLNLAQTDEKSENPLHYSRSGWLSEKGLKSGLKQIFKYFLFSEEFKFAKLIMRLDDHGDYIIEHQNSLRTIQMEKIPKHKGLIVARKTYLGFIYSIISDYQKPLV